jgi:hypothetical protein
LGERSVKTEPYGDREAESGPFISPRICGQVAEGGTGVTHIILNMETKNLFKDDTTRGVFEAVAKPRTILVRDLKINFPNLDLKRSITLLKDADLIKEQPAVIDDFSTLYVTANGLNLAQAMKRADLQAELAYLS